jgi:hypothetical protein
MSRTLFVSGARLSGLCLFAVLLTACVTGGTRPGNEVTEAKKETRTSTVAVAQPSLSKAQQELGNGVTSYEDGAYKQSARQLQNALSLGLDSGKERARAYKYLAFMDCVGKRQKQCREDFSMALDADPGFELTPAEAGHPIWGPVYRKVKADKASADKNTKKQGFFH